MLDTHEVTGSNPVPPIVHISCFIFWAVILIRNTHGNASTNFLADPASLRNAPKWTGFDIFMGWAEKGGWKGFDIFIE